MRWLISRRPMNDRRQLAPPRDTDGEPLIDAGVLTRLLNMTPAGARRWVARRGIGPVRKGAHGAWMYRLSEVQAVLDQAP